jgi:sugar-specific transcriptional regulator TrmB
MNLQKVVADAVDLYTPTSSGPVVSVYSGIEGIKEIYLDTLKLSGDQMIYAFLNPEEVHKDIYSWLTTEYVKERVKRGIAAHVYISGKKDSDHAAKYMASDEAEKRTTHYVEDFGKPFECEVDIYGDKVALINYNPKDELMGIIIHHPIIVQTIRSFYLHFFWKM